MAKPHDLSPRIALMTRMLKLPFIRAIRDICGGNVF
jgi:hypothetical protein